MDPERNCCFRRFVHHSVSCLLPDNPVTYFRGPGNGAGREWKEGRRGAADGLVGKLSVTDHCPWCTYKDAVFLPAFLVGELRYIDWLSGLFVSRFASSTVEFIGFL